MKSIKLSNLFFILLMFPFIEPRIFSEMPILTRFNIHGLYNYARYCSFIIIILYNLLRSKIKYSYITILIIVYFFFMILSTIINGGDIKTVLTYSLEACGVCIFADVYISEYGISRYCENMFKLLIVFISINCVTIFLFPTGLYTDSLLTLRRTQNWFLGYKNSHVYIYLPGLFYAFVYSLQYKNMLGIKHIIGTIIIIFSIWISDSTTSLVLIITFCIYLLLVYKNNFSIFENTLLQYIVILLINSILLFTNFIELAQELISVIFGKYSTVASRTSIWNRAIYYIKEKPIMGNGIEYYDVSLTKIYGQAHNKLLDVTYVGGVIGLFCFLFILFYCMNKISNCENKKIKKVCTIVLLCYNILFVTEAQRSNALFFAILISICHICKNEKSIKNTR